MSKSNWNTSVGREWHDYLTEGCDGEEIARKQKHKNRRAKKSRMKDKHGRVYNGHMGTWVYEHGEN